ncbi:MAG: DUF3137 domain-containing protein [Coriobacteriales bacterium]|jgi:hypothetical protein|nr:DUF3137 domain-containing protein [Coriobacteriales bacterium]
MTELIPLLLWPVIRIFLLVALICVPFFIYFSVARKKRKEKKAELVDVVLLPALNQVFSNLHYSANDYIPLQMIMASKMFKGWSTAQGSDYIDGWHNGRHIQMSDVILTHTETESRTNSKGESETYTQIVTDFRGQWVVCDFDKAVTAQLTICAGKCSPRTIKKLAESSSIAEMDNTVFNEKYTVLTDNPHDAFYILTPHMMEYIMAADQQVRGRLSLEFLPNEKIHIAINSGRDFFEPKKIWREMDYEQERNKVLEEIYSIINMIEQLRLVDTSNRSG